MTQQQPEEGRPYLGMGQGVPYEGRLSPQEAAESFPSHPQEEWMEELRKHLERYPYKARPEVKGLSWWHGYEAEFVESFIKSQLEAAEKRGREKMLKSWQEFLRDYGTDEVGFRFSDETYDKFLASLTNHN